MQISQGGGTLHCEYIIYGTNAHTYTHTNVTMWIQLALPSLLPPPPPSACMHPPCLRVGPHQLQHALKGWQDVLLDVPHHVEPLLPPALDQLHGGADQVLGGGPQLTACHLRACAVGEAVCVRV